MTDDTRYVRYSDSVEVRQDDEDALIEKIVASMARVNRDHYERHRHAGRDAHAKSHGIATGTFTVYDGLPAHLRQGVFAEPRSYPIVVRFSSAPSEILSDRVPALRGLAIKMMGVDGPQMLPENRDAKTQDWLLVNNPVIAFGHVAAYWKTQRFTEKFEQGPEIGRHVTGEVLRGVSLLLDKVGGGSDLVRSVATPNTHLLGETFHSMAALRFGDYLAKISAAPLSPEVRRLTGQSLGAVPEHSQIRDQTVAFFEQHEAEYELRAQLCTDLSRMPVEDASIRWDENESPHQPIAKITLPRQAVYSPARRVYGDDVLSFNPFHGIEAHRPLGSIMRVRRQVYESSSRFRHEMNAQPRVEPRSLADIPA